MAPITLPFDLDLSRQAFEQSQDFTVGIEEEYAILNPHSLDLTPGFEELNSAAQNDPVLSTSISGELISSEIEIRSGRGNNLSEAIQLQRECRKRLFALAADHDLALGSTGTHPWSDYRDQKIINTDHYRHVDQDLGYVAWRNNTFSTHVHVGIRGADRAVQVCERMRGVLPLLLAISANSPYLDGRDTRLHSARTQIFTRAFPRAGIPDPFANWGEYENYLNFLFQSKSIIEHTQVWWAVRPHPHFGTVEVRICDAQSTAQEAEALIALIVACVAQSARDQDAGVAKPTFAGGVRSLSANVISENLWRALRYGRQGSFINLADNSEFPSDSALEVLLDWTEPVRAELEIHPQFPEYNGAQRQLDMGRTGVSLREIYAQAVEENTSTRGAPTTPRQHST